MVTAETAAVLPVLALLLAMAMGAVSAAGAQVRCGDAAREAARAAARGDPDDQVRRTALRAAPAGARVTVVRTSEEVRVGVFVTVRLLGRRLLSVVASGEAVSARETTGAGAAATAVAVATQ